MGQAAGFVAGHRLSDSLLVPSIDFGWKQTKSKRKRIGPFVVFWGYMDGARLGGNSQKAGIVKSAESLLENISTQQIRRPCEFKLAVF